MVHCHNLTRLASISSVTTATAFTFLRSYSSRNDKVTEEQGTVASSQWQSNSVSNLNDYLNSGMFCYAITLCEEGPHTGDKVYTAYQKQQDKKGTSEFSFKLITKTQSLLYKLHLLNDKSLPTPRLLSPTDPIFRYRKLTTGLKQREKDEVKLRELQTEITSLVEKQNKGKNNDGDEQDRMKTMTSIMKRLSEIAYGKGVTPQKREDFLVVSEQNCCLLLIDLW